MRALYVYRLDVTYPDGSATIYSDGSVGTTPNWEPADLVSDRGEFDDDTGAWVEAPFEWPRPKRYLSYSGARRRAKLLEGWGATVVIRRSEPVVFP